jgi:CDP-diacylglycerol--serine O-phosphatidyltransferase
MNLANALSLAGLTAALACALLAARGALAPAIVALIISGLCDLFDGFVARRLERSEEAKRFGGHLDSVVDACSFGLAPAVLLHGAGLRSAPEFLVLALFAACAAWRLAYFDTVGLAAEGDARYYTGLPTTFVALVLPFALLAGFVGPSTLRAAGNVAALGLAAAMVSSLRIRKPGGTWYAILLGAAVAMIAVYAALGPSFAAV